MRLIASFLLCSVALNAGAADIWRWTDADGVVHFSDQPRPGAVKVNIGAAPKPSGSGPEPQPIPEVAASAPSARPASYTQCIVQSPAKDETFNGVQPVAVALTIEPGLQPGHRVQVYFDGAPLTAWPAQALNYTLPEVYRGSHTLQVRVVDSSSRVLCDGPSSTFHLRQTGLNSPLSPLRPQPAPSRPPAVPTPRPAPGAPVG